ncbi:MAG: 3-isopropylmalate dehydratase large subunit [Promethearchaeota archaeon]
MAGQTMAEKILARHAKKNRTEPGEIVEAGIDLAMSHEMLGSLVLPHLREAGVEKFWNPDHVVVALDHWGPASSIEAAALHQKVRKIVQRFEISHFYDVGVGISHQVLAEKGHLRPGELLVGTDSHTTTGGAFGVFATGIGAADMTIVLATGRLWFRVPETIQIDISGKLPGMVMGKDIILHLLGQLGTGGAAYQSVEFHGKGISNLSLDARMTLTNMAAEAGAKTAIIPPDALVEKYVKARTTIPYKPVIPDSDASYIQTYQIDIGDLTPQIALPPLPTKVVPVAEAEGTAIDQAFIGSCTNGRLEDLRVAAHIVQGQETAKGIRFLVMPASREIYQSALNEGLIEILVKAGATLGPSTCGPCFGGHCGLLAPREVCISTSNRNFKGRMGSPDADIYLASPATVAASALAGHITDPRKGD